MPADYSGRRIELYIMVGIASAGVSLFLIVDFARGSGGVLYGVWEEIGAVNFYIIGLMLISAIYFLYYAQKMWRFRAEFHELMDTGSKAMFLRNLDRIEFLAWKLGEDAHSAVQEKRGSFGIRRRK